MKYCRRCEHSEALESIGSKEVQRQKVSAHELLVKDIGKVLRRACEMIEVLSS